MCIQGKEEENHVNDLEPNLYVIKMHIILIFQLAYSMFEELVIKYSKKPNYTVMVNIVLQQI